MIDQSKNVRSIFLEIVEKAPREKWAESLDQACGDNEQLRSEVQRLVSAHEEIGTFMDRPAADRFTVDSPIAEAPGTVIGPYKLLQQIGEGGMGVVFMAEQTEPIQRTVALKIIKPGMDTRQVIARFEAERQALALMDHPNIAKVHDAGTTETSRPYFVMELVKGVPITKYCDEKHLSIRERLELFKPVCEAVQHAHQKGIIHRDLKPTNVLVAEYDNRAVPKVIDFGVAKATAQKLTERTMFTEFGQVIGTVEYMSPEQAKFNQLDIDTRSDIYSLGVLLYELLTGSTPFEQKRLREAAFDEVLRIIREEEPPKPSTRLSTADALPSIAANRHTEPARLSKEVSGELDWIVMKCLEKDRNRRYETANGLGRDIERHLADQPVEARRPSGAYRFKKFLRRNKVGVLACVSILIALLVGLTVASTGYLQARRQAAVTSRITQYMQQMLYSADPASAKPPNYTVRELLDDFSRTIDAELADDPEVAVVLYSTIGNAYAELVENQRALQHLSQALALKRSIYGPRHENYADGLIDYARGIFLSQVFGGDFTPAKYDEGVAKVNEALNIYRTRGIEGQRIIHALWALQLFYGRQGNLAGVERVAHEAAVEAAKTPGVTYWEIPTIRDSLVTPTIANGNLANAERIARENLDADVAKHGMNSLQTAWAYRTYGEALAAQKKYKEAIQADEQALTIMRKMTGPGHLYLEHPRTAIAAHLAGASQAGALSDVVATVEELAKKELLFRENLHLPPREPRRRFDPSLLAAQGLSQFPAFYLELGKELARAGKSAEAETARDRARRLAESLVAELDDRPEFLPIVYAARLDSDSTEDGDEIRRRLAGELSQLALKIQRVKDPTTSAGALYLVALLQLQVGDKAGYRATCQAQVDLPFDKIEGDTKSVTIWTLCIGQDALDDPNLPVKLSKEFVANHTLGEPHDGLFVLGASLYRAGRYEQAADRLKEFVAAFPRYAPSRLFLAMTQWKLGRRNEARKILSEILPTVDTVLQSPSMEWNRRAMLEILRDEAVALIGQTKTDEPLENKSRSKDESKKPPSTLNPKR